MKVGDFLKAFSTLFQKISRAYYLKFKVENNFFCFSFPHLHPNKSGLFVLYSKKLKNFKKIFSMYLFDKNYRSFN